MYNKLYHSTSIHGITQILEQSCFHLTFSGGTGSERTLHNRKTKLFYLSTARVKNHDYLRSSTYRYGVNLTLNADWLRNRFPVKPVDYWGEGWKKDETEERIYSDKPIMRIDPRQVIKEIHLLYTLDEDPNENFSRWLRRLLIAAKRRGIPLFYYVNQQSFLNQDLRKTVPLRQLIARLETKKIPQPALGWKHSDFLARWRELYFKNKSKDLSKEASTIAYYLAYKQYSHAEYLHGFENELHNAKKDVVQMQKMMGIWRRLKIHSAKEYFNFLAEKWKLIKENENK